MADRAPRRPLAGARQVAAVLVALAGLAFAVIVPAVVLAATASVTIGNSLEPAKLEVRPGTVITRTNASGDRHRMRTTSDPDEFDSGDLDPGATAGTTITWNATPAPWTSSAAGTPGLTRLAQHPRLPGSWSGL